MAYVRSRLLATSMALGSLTAGFTTAAWSLETITLDNVVMDNGDKGTATIKSVEVVGTNLTKDEVQKLFTPGVSKEDAGAILKKLVASRITIPEVLISNKEGKLTVTGLQATDVDAGKIGHAAMGGLDGAFTNEKGPVTVKSGPIAVDGAGLTGFFSAVQTGELSNATTHFGHFSWKGLEITAPDKDTPASTPGGNIVKVKLGSITADGTADGDVPLKTTAVIENLVVELPPGSPPAQSLKAAGYDKLDLGFTFSSAYDPAQKTLAIDDFKLSGANMGSLALKFVLGGIDKTLFTGKQEERIAAMIGGNISSLEIRFLDAGLADKALATAALQQGTTPDALKAQGSAMATQLIPAMLGGDPSSLKIAEQVSRFIGSPKGLTIVAKPKSGSLAFTDAFGLADPSTFLQKIDVTVVAQGDPAGAPPAAASPAPAAPAAAASAPAASAPAANAPATQKLTGLAAWNALVGNSISGKNDDGDPLVEYYLANGTVKQLVDDDDVNTGKWAVRGKQVCFEYPDDDDESCYEIVVDGNIATFTDEDGAGHRYQILKGNPKKL